MSNDHRIRWMLRLAASAVISTFLTACAYQGGGGVYYPGGPVARGPAVYGLERGSRFEASLTGNDRQAIAMAAGDLLASGQSGAVRAWNGGYGDAGEIRLGTTYLIGLDAAQGAPVPAPTGIDTSVPLAPASGNYVTTKNANVRLGASPSAMVSETLNAGTKLRAYGYDRAGDWYLVGAPDAVLGYVSGQLLSATGGGDPVLAGGSPKRPRLCRDVNLSLTTQDARSDSWTSFVCQTETGWEVPSERGLS